MTSPSRPHSVLDVDDSAFMRKVVSELLAESDDYRIHGMSLRL